MFSKACTYGIKAMLFVAQKSQDETRVSLTQIAEAIDSPVAFTAKILQALVKAQLVNSLKGPYGGFMISKDRLSTINIKDVVEAIDGDRLFSGCTLGLDQCDEERPCPIHNDFMQIRAQLTTVLTQTTLDTVADELNDGLTFLKR